MLLSSPRHSSERIRQEPKRRTLTVVEAFDLTPQMRRIILTSPELADFASPAPDDHIKLFLPDPAAPTGEVMRDYTPRRFDAARCRLTLDFALHEAGPATLWAQSARPGDRLTIGGPKGSLVVADDFDWYLLIGDESAWPAIARRIEGLRAGVPVTSLAVVADPGEVQPVETAARHRPLWVFRSGHGDSDASLLREALAQWQPPEGDGYVWIAGEAQTARALKTEMIERGHPQA